MQPSNFVTGIPNWPRLACSIFVQLPWTRGLHRFSVDTLKIDRYFAGNLRMDSATSLSWTGEDARHPSIPFTSKQKPPACGWRLKSLSSFARPGRARAPVPTRASVFVQQHAFGFLRVHRTVVQLVVPEEDLDERRPGGDGALNQRL